MRLAKKFASFAHSQSLSFSLRRKPITKALLTEGRRVQFNPSKVDVIEIDPVNQATLRGLGFKVVGHDFLEFQGGAMYSYILLNPPFSHGVDHVLHAWNLLHDGEIVAIINAESLRNPYSVKRQHLAKLVQEHGSVDFIDGAFDTGEEERSAGWVCTL